jgi:arsenite methyltransferase
MKTSSSKPQSDSIRSSVREHYGKVAQRQGGCGCGPTCCSGTDSNALPALPSIDPATHSQAVGYSADDLSAVPKGANLGLGCGNPMAIADLKPGQTVLDLGSGAGFDAFLAAKAVGKSGRVIGVDMTPEMINKARENLARSGLINVEFRLGEIESLPIADATVDVILSNCVINLSPDKGRVFAEAFRALRPGGRLAISDIVALVPMPEPVREEVALYTGCVAGAALVSELETLLRAAGFAKIQIEPKAQSREFIQNWFPGRGLENYVASATIEATKTV